MNNNCPKIVRILMKNLSQKRQNFDEIVVFSAGSEKSSVLWRTRFFGFRRKSRISQNYDDFATRAAAPKIPASFLSVALTTLIYGFLLPP